ncbi:hypothetical protein DWU89_08180 [Parabacteroides acidifaciens]|uniref:Uncharacterized protein n=1 Tax=Parabacteroides acidifaciens TaxID=2290935 RepID=A0A3D8HFY2_9BACT|nr:hypothetical protein DWU89_08180 [Parabacteroides acidifaciens]
MNIYPLVWWIGIGHFKIKQNKLKNYDISSVFFSIYSFCLYGGRKQDKDMFVISLVKKFMYPTCL